jgi:hypothetical protein
MKYAHLLPVLAFCGLAGCVDDELSLSINAFAATEPPDCTADPQTNEFVGGALLDVGIVESGFLSGARGLVVVPIIQNNLVKRSTAMTVEMDAVFVTGFDVEIKIDPRDPALAAAIPLDQLKFFYPTAGGRIAPGDKLSLPAEVLGANLANKISMSLPVGRRPVAPAITIRMRAVGTRAGLKLNGGWVNFPVDVCKFCLSSVEACPATGIPEKSILTGGCYPWMDQSVTCCMQNGSLLCGENVPVMTTTM